jgi:uncharacterized protein (TIRG00374 family)
VLHLTLDRSVRSPAAIGRLLSSSRRFLETAGVLSVAALLAWFVWTHTDVGELRVTFLKISWPYYAAGVGALFVYQAIRALRIRPLINRAIRFPRLFLTMCLHCIINTFVPGVAGELSLVYLLLRRHKAGLHLTTAAMVLTRVADVAVFLFVFLILIAFMAQSIPKEIYLVMLGIGAVLLVPVAALFLFGQMAERHFTLFAARQGMWAWAARNGLVFIEALQQIRNPRILMPLFAQSAGMWIVSYLQWLFLLKAAGLALSPAAVLWIFVLFFPYSFLPFKGVAAIGPALATWFYALQFVGLPERESASVAFALEILFQSATLWVGALPLLAILWVTLRKCTVHRREES